MMLRRPLPRADERNRVLGAGYPVWEIFGQLTIVVFVFVGFDTARVLTPKPVFLLTVLPVVGAVLFAPRGTFQKVRVSASMVLLLSWWIASYAWVPVSWKSEFRPINQAAAFVALSMIASTVRLDRLRSVWLGSLYVMTAYTYLYTAVNYQEATRIFDVTNGSLANIGWHGAFNHKNNLASFMVVAIISTLSLERNQRRRRLAIPSMVALVFLSRSGTGAGAMLAALGVYVIAIRYSQQSRRQSGVLVFLSALTSIIGVVVGGLFLPSILGLYGKDLTLTGRVDIWSSVWPAIRARPWTGYGWSGVWTDPTAEPTRSILRRLGFSVFHAHNGPLETILEVGLIGLALYLAVLLATVDGGRRVLRVDPKFGAAVLAYCVFVTVSSFSEVLTVGPWLSLLALLRVLTLRVLAEAGERAAGPALAGQTVSTRPAASSTAAASAIAAKRIAERSAMSTRDRRPSD